MRFRVFSLVVLCAAVLGTGAKADDIGAASRGVVRVIAVVADDNDPSISFGSGFAISPHQIVTNAHVVENVRYSLADSIVAIVPAEGRKAVAGEIVAFDSARDLAIVDVGEARLEPLAIYSGPVEPGLHAAALGYPGNVDLATARSMYDLITPSSPVRSEGNISSERAIDGTPALLHTAAISRGNSGGPLVDECGRVLGVNTYTARSGSGDAPFGFAIVSRQLMSFLRDQGSKFVQVGSACVTMAEQLRREKDAQADEDRAEAAAKARASQQEQQRIEAAKAAAMESRENHVAGAVFMSILALIAAGAAAALFVKNRARAATAAAVAAGISFLASAYTFFTRPSLKVELSPVTAAAEPIAAPLSGKLRCQVEHARSRVTVSPTDDLEMTWDAYGCMNGRTQYVQDGGNWRKVLVPNGSETVALQDFDPAKGEYVSRRYHLPQSEMERLRAIRGDTAGAKCNRVAQSTELESVTEQLVSSLPPTPNEKIVYRCSAA